MSAAEMSVSFWVFELKENEWGTSFVGHKITVNKQLFAISLNIST